MTFHKKAFAKFYWFAEQKPSPAAQKTQRPVSREFTTFLGRDLLPCSFSAATAVLQRW